MNRHRTGAVLIAFGYLGSGIASAMGSAPDWPTPIVWSFLAFAAAASSLLFALRPSPTSLQLLTVTVVVAAAARGGSYFVNAPTTAGRLAAGGAWLVVVGLGLSFHASRRRSV